MEFLERNNLDEGAKSGPRYRDGNGTSEAESFEASEGPPMPPISVTVTGGEALSLKGLGER